MSRIVIGMTGGIGSGKSAVSQYLKECGEHVICADEVSRKVVRRGEEGSKAIRHVFGDTYFLEDGSLDRKKLGAEVFSQADKLKMLNGILHPIIVEYIFNEARRLDGRVFIDAALLIQTNMHERVDIVWLVVADMQKRIERVIKRDKLSEAAIKARIDAQMSDQDMAVYADEVIDNSGSFDELHKRIALILNKPVYLR